MARFALNRDIRFFEGITRELVDVVIETAVVLYKLVIEDSKTNLYGESLSKTYYQGVQTTAVIERESSTTQYEGFGPDKEKNQAIVGAVDKLSNEPRDLQYGKFIYDAVSKLYNESDVEDARVRELFFASLYKLPDEEFFPFIENAINNELTRDQKNWAAGEMRDIEKDLKKDDTGLEDLDEGIDDPVKPGILKKRLGKLSCSRVRSAKSKLKNKGTHYAKALQRYLNYHC